MPHDKSKKTPHCECGDMTLREASWKTDAEREVRILYCGNCGRIFGTVAPDVALAI